MTIPLPTPTRHRLYLCGPMTGLPDFNYPAFNDAAAMLRAAGYEVINPAENGLPANAPWPEHMKRDIAHLVQCTGVAVLPGHLNSRGARLELHIATELDIPAAAVSAWLDPWVKRMRQATFNPETGATR